ncbi:hypothetical protein PR048_008244 [Dryococelus australis]|uniref:Uncharacterized protein n=1 Tax=Dryococelus australis TaxID=614101 RepID=A0ABQ9HWK1_9NEOP|nr:hypothetical protein PR048_008244 [Dryococelus australis]
MRFASSLRLAGGRRVNAEVRAGWIRRPVSESQEGINKCGTLKHKLDCRQSRRALEKARWCMTPRSLTRPRGTRLLELFFTFGAEKRGIDKGETPTCIKCAIAATQVSELACSFLVVLRIHMGLSAGARLPPRRSAFDIRRVHSRIFACGNRAGRCRLLAVFSGYSRFPRPYIPAPLHPRVSFHVMSRDDGRLRVPAGKPVTRIKSTSVKRRAQQVHARRPCGEAGLFVNKAAESDVTHLTCSGARQRLTGRAAGPAHPPLPRWCAPGPRPSRPAPLAARDHGRRARQSSHRGEARGGGGEPRPHGRGREVFCWGLVGPPADRSGGSQCVEVFRRGASGQREELCAQLARDVLVGKEARGVAVVNNNRLNDPRLERARAERRKMSAGSRR